MDNGACQWGRYPSGKKRRWPRAKKVAAKRARVEEWLSIARSWRRKKEEGDDEESTTLTRGGVGRWVEELPWELWELIFQNLNAVDCLSCVTSTKRMMEKYEKTSTIADLRADVRDEVQAARAERYTQRVKAAVDYYILYNIEARQPGVGYRYVSKQFGVGKPDLQEGVEARLDYYRYGNDESDVSV